MAKARGFTALFDKPTSATDTNCVDPRHYSIPLVLSLSAFHRHQREASSLSPALDIQRFAIAARTSRFVERAASNIAEASPLRICSIHAPLTSEGTVTLSRLSNRKYLASLRTTMALAQLVAEAQATRMPVLTLPTAKAGGFLLQREQPEPPK